jgi:DNA-binding protein H-NS
MARQLAARTVVAWFGNLSFDQQNEVLGQMQQAHDHARSAKRAELESQLAALGFTMPKRRGRPPANASMGSNAAQRKSTRRTGKVKAKYRDPKTNETWSGRGRMASWLKSKQDAGEKIEKYLV